MNSMTATEVLTDSEVPVPEPCEPDCVAHTAHEIVMSDEEPPTDGFPFMAWGPKWLA